jgi:hypothetical protein
MPTITHTVVSSTATGFRTEVTEPLTQSQATANGDVVRVYLLPMTEESFTRITRLVTPDGIAHLRFLAELDPSLCGLRIDARVRRTSMPLPKDLTVAEFLDNIRHEVTAQHRHLTDVTPTGDMVTEDKMTSFYRADEHFTVLGGDYADDPYSSVIQSFTVTP